MTSFGELARVAESNLPSLVSHLWSSTLFLLLVLLIILVMRNHLTAGARFSLAFLGIVKFAIPGGAVIAGVRALTGDRFRMGSSDVWDIPLQVVGGGLQFNPDPTTPGLWPGIAVAVWFTVTTGLLLRFALVHHRLVSLSVRAALPPQPREVEALTRARRRVGVRRSIDLARSALPEAPAVLRIFRPLILLPAGGCDELSDDELESLLCHECAHVARHDNLIARLESVICALFWFHPLVWIARRITAIERERACDEVVAGSADERETYLTALRKFCHAAIAPRLPGVSCMGTSKLKQRMDHVMNYPTLRAQSPSPKGVAAFATAALVLFTLVSGLAGTKRALAGGTKKADEPYSIRITANRTGESIAVQAAVSKRETLELIAAPNLTFAAGDRASARTSAKDVVVAVDVQTLTEDRIAVEVAVSNDFKLLQKNTFFITPVARTAAEKREQFTGEPITIALEDAGLRDVLNTFGSITGMKMRIDESIDGKVSVNWHNVPWDEAFDSLLKENGLKYRIEGSTIHVSKK